MILSQNQNTPAPAADGKSDNNKHFSAKSALGGLPNAQTLLQQPPLQVLVIERMHSGLLTSACVFCWGFYVVTIEVKISFEIIIGKLC
jgi:hypothetical protein